MTNVSSRSLAHTALPCLVCLALLGASGCGAAPESESGESSEATSERPATDAEMARVAEEVAPEESQPAVAEPGGEHREGYGEGEHRAGGEHEGDGEHGEHSEGGEHGEEGEESGEYIVRSDTWDATRRGVRLTLSLDETRGAFTGTVENITQAAICNVRVEVHLTSGPELGPTEGVDLAPGASSPVSLPSGGESFESWTAHPESSPCANG